MKKTTVLLVLAMVMMLMCGTAQAEKLKKPVNPYYREAVNPVFHAAEDSATGMMAELECLEEPELMQMASWQVHVQGGTAPYTYQYYVLNADGQTNTYAHWSDNAAFEHDFIVPGDYVLQVNVKDSQGEIVSARAEIVVVPQRFNAVAGEEDTSASRAATTVSEKVEEVVELCFAAVDENNEYDVALWLYDWLIKNAYYDQTYTYYNADGVLLRGTGVCDSYAKAYVALLKEAGIEAKRQTGYGNGESHAWALVKINGDWYQCDPTWSDPITGVPEWDNVPVSGYENYRYFGLSDDLMKMDHSYSSSTPCTSYKENYYVHSGLIYGVLSDSSAVDYDILVADPENEGWYYFEDTIGYTWKGFQRGVRNAASFPVTFTLVENLGLIRINEDYLEQPFFLPLAAYVLEQQTWERQNSQIRCTVEADAANNALIFNLDESASYVLEALVTENNIIELNKAVTYTVQYSGNDVIEEMEYQVYDQTGTVVASWKGISDTYTFVPRTAGQYIVRVHVKPQHGEWMYVDSEPLTVVVPVEPLKLNEFYTDVAELKVGEQINFILRYEGNDFDNVAQMLFYTYDGNGQQLGDPWVYDGFIGHYGFISNVPGRYAIRVFALMKDGSEMQVVTSPFFQVTGEEEEKDYIVLTGFTADREELRVMEQINFLLTYTGTDTSNVGWMRFYTYNIKGEEVGDPWTWDGFIGHYGFISSMPGQYAIRAFLVPHEGEMQVVTSPFFNVLPAANQEAPVVTVEPTAEPTVEPTAEPTAEPTTVPEGISFENAIRAGKSIKADVQYPTYYRVALEEGEYTVKLEGDKADVKIFNEAKQYVLHGQTVEGKLEAKIAVAAGEYYVVLEGGKVELTIEAYEEPVVEEPVVEEPVVEEPVVEEPVVEEPVVEEPVVEEPVVEEPEVEESVVEEPVVEEPVVEEAVVEEPVVEETVVEEPVVEEAVVEEPVVEEPVVEEPVVEEPVVEEPVVEEPVVEEPVVEEAAA